MQNVHRLLQCLFILSLSIRRLHTVRVDIEDIEDVESLGHREEDLLAMSKNIIVRYAGNINTISKNIIARHVGNTSFLHVSSLATASSIDSHWSEFVWLFLISILATLLCCIVYSVRQASRTHDCSVGTHVMAPTVEEADGQSKDSNSTPEKRCEPDGDTSGGPTVSPARKRGVSEHAVQRGEWLDQYMKIQDTLNSPTVKRLTSQDKKFGEEPPRQNQVAKEIQGAQIEELYNAGRRALHFIDGDDWRSMLARLRELRKDKVNENHPVYSTLEAHFEEPGTQSQIESLFSELSEGDERLSVEAVRRMLTHFQMDVTNLNDGRYLGMVKPDFQWLRDGIEKQLTLSAFANILILLLVVLVQRGTINQRADGSAQAEKGEDVDTFKFDYYVEIHGKVFYRNHFIAGNFIRLGAKIYLDREDKVQTCGKGSNIG